MFLFFYFSKFFNNKSILLYFLSLSLSMLFFKSVKKKLDLFLFQNFCLMFDNSNLKSGVVGIPFDISNLLPELVTGIVTGITALGCYFFYKTLDRFVNTVFVDTPYGPSSGGYPCPISYTDSEDDNPSESSPIDDISDVNSVPLVNVSDFENINNDEIISSQTAPRVEITEIIASGIDEFPVTSRLLLYLLPHSPQHLVINYVICNFIAYSLSVYLNTNVATISSVS